MDRQKIIVVGGGAAGFFGALSCAENSPEAEIHILEQGKQFLGKVKISGGGRCNVTHACFDPRELIQYYPRGAKALLGPFHQFMTGDTMAWFEERGVMLKIEEDGRIFPQSNDSQTIIDCFVNEARRLGIETHLQSGVNRLEKNGDKWIVQTRDGHVWRADRVLIATGSNSEMWRMLERLGHKLVKPVPSLFTFNIKDERISDLAGISVPYAKIKVQDSKLKEQGPLLITHWGLSGPAVLKMSAWGAREWAEKKYKGKIRVNWAGKSEMNDVLEEIQQIKMRQARKYISRNSWENIPSRLWQSLVKEAGIREDLRWADCSKKQTKALAEQISGGEYFVEGKSTFKEEFVTAGGIDLKEINFKTMESKLLNGLFFAGEVMDIDAVTGGFNFQAAWTSSWIAGRSM